MTTDRKGACEPKYHPLWNNVITITGLFFAAMAVLLLLTFALFSFVVPNTNPYVDIVGFLILPGILLGGLLIVPFGILLKSWRLRRRDPELRLAFRFPRIDLNDPAQRRMAKAVILGTFILLPVVGVSSYQGYHYTDSAEFCAKACHSVMEPQATAYEHSAHARVACADCHIGEGAGWFVKAKLSGTRQVLATLRESYSRPIPPAIQHLRPARETCEQCHWPKKFFGAQLREIPRFRSDESNTRLDIAMLIKTGGGDETTGRAEGIHMHMALEGRIEYVATDDRLQEIPWIRYVDDAAGERIFRSDDRPSSDARPVGQVRRFDCMDCHNRPSHKFRDPQSAVDILLDLGKVDTALPFIKREAVGALERPYPDVSTAEKEMADRLIGFYTENYAELWKDPEFKALVNQAVDGIREIYRRNFYPGMKVDWRTYPDNIGHMNSPGCFRCHDGKHVDQNGVPISHECDVCHVFLNPVLKNGHDSFIQKGAFFHPFALEGPHAILRCDQCHDGGSTPPATCSGCHAREAAFRNGTLLGFESIAIPADPMAGAVDCRQCHDFTGPGDLQTIDAACMDCHDDEEERFDGMLASWKREVDKLFRDAEARSDDRGRALLRSLQAAGPLHNIEATRAIVQSLAAESNTPHEP